MGFGFRKSIRLGKGVRLNLSKSGVGISAGVKGFRVSTGPKGSRVTTSIPGTGIYYSEKIGGKKKRTTKNKNFFEDNSDFQIRQKNKKTNYFIYFIIFIMAFISLPLAVLIGVIYYIYSSFVTKNNKKNTENNIYNSDINNFSSDLEKKEEVNTLVKEEKDKNDLTIPAFKISIPENILNLLWFANGKYANYNYLDSEESEIDVEGIKVKINFSSSSDEEPSLIYTTLKVEEPKNTNPTDKIGYFPSYKGLTPEQRYIYLKWLENPLNNTNIDIGYVFLFYYGLERYLFLKNSKEALKMIFDLLKIYKNPSFFSYGFKCLLFYCIFSNDINAVKKLLELYSGNSELELYAKYTAKVPLYASDIMDLSSEVGFLNKRYIKMYPDLFLKILEENIIEKYEKNSVDLEKYYSHSLKMCSINAVANISLRKENIDIPDFLSSNELSSELCQLLMKTHEDVKKKLKDERKGNKIKKLN